MPFTYQDWALAKDQVGIRIKCKAWSHLSKSLPHNFQDSKYSRKTLIPSGKPFSFSQSTASHEDVKVTFSRGNRLRIRSITSFGSGKGMAHSRCPVSSMAGMFRLMGFQENITFKLLSSNVRGGGLTRYSVLVLHRIREKSAPRLQCKYSVNLEHITGKLHIAYKACSLACYY